MAVVRSKPNVAWPLCILHVNIDVINIIIITICTIQGCIWRGVRRVWPPARSSWPPESSAEPLWGSILTPLRTLGFNFLAKPVCLYTGTTIRRLRLYRDRRDLFSKLLQFARYQFGNIHARYSRSVSHSQWKLWPRSENLTNTALAQSTTTLGVTACWRELNCDRRSNCKVDIVPRCLKLWVALKCTYIGLYVGLCV